jgi:hypothetical protein
MGKILSPNTIQIGGGLAEAFLWFQNPNVKDKSILYMRVSINEDTGYHISNFRKAPY